MNAANKGVKAIFEKLKQRLRENKGAYVEENSWCGSTEEGFYTEVIFDIDKLMAEIDEFAKTFEPGGENYKGHGHDPQ